MPKKAHLLGIAFLAIQVFLVFRARFVSERFFCWAPFDEASRFETQVRIGSRVLSPEEANQRYRYWSAGWENRSVHNVIGMIRRYESTYGKGDSAEVVLTYSFNGHPAQVWRWPEMP